VAVDQAAARADQAVQLLEQTKGPDAMSGPFLR